VLAGVAGGLFGSVAGLASIATYPALLAAGLPPVTANVTNTVSLVFSSVGSISASRPELTGQRRRVRQLGAAGMIGGATGALLLLVTPSGSFEKAVPVLVLIAAVAIMLRRRLVDDMGDVADLIDDGDDVESEAAPADQGDSPGELGVGRGVVFAVGAVGVYGGYFGAGAGVLVLALLLHATHDSLPRANALKNVVLGLANGIAALGFVIFGPVHWVAVVPLGAGLLVGARVGPSIVRHSPAGPLRLIIAVAGVGLAVKLGYSTYIA